VGLFYNAPEPTRGNHDDDDFGLRRSWISASEAQRSSLAHRPFVTSLLLLVRKSSSVSPEPSQFNVDGADVPHPSPASDGDRWVDSGSAKPLLWPWLDVVTTLVQWPVHAARHAQINHPRRRSFGASCISIEWNVCCGTATRCVLHRRCVEKNSRYVRQASKEVSKFIKQTCSYTAE